MAYDTGEFRQAESLLARAHEMARELPEHTFAENSADIGRGAVLLATSRVKEAEECLRKVASRLEGHPGDELRELQAVALRFLAQAYSDGGDAKAAEEELKKSVAILRELGPDAGVQLAYSLCDVCGLLLAQGQYAEAELKITEAMSILGKVLGTDAPEYVRADMIFTACMPMNDASHLDSAGDGIEKMRYFYGAKHPNINRALHRYFKVLEEKGDKTKLEEAKVKFGVSAGEGR